MKPILFVHIPKTAGTSLNASAEEHFGSTAIEKDYGESAPHTSDLVRRFIYEGPTADQFGFADNFLNANKAWLTGHFAADRYLPFVGCENAISFVRDPVERIISEYLYRRRTQGLTCSFEEFFQRPDETNKQYAFVGRFPWRAFHFVGTQERYAEGLAHLRETLGIPIKLQEKNRRIDQEHETINQAVREAVAARNLHDQALYDQACAYMEKQFAARKAGLSFCYHDIGFESEKHAIGWAFYEANNTPVTIELSVDGKAVSTIEAIEHRPELQLLKAPREGCVGFRFVLSDYVGASSIEIVAKQTDQKLLSWTRN